MKKILLLMVAVLMVANVAMADNIGVYSDASGTSCILAPGFSFGVVTVLHKYTLGATGSRFMLDASNAPGTSLIAFTTPYTPVGNIAVDLALGYGGCEVGTVNLGTLTIIAALGYMDVKAATGFPDILYTDCAFNEKLAYGSRTWIGTPPPLATCNEVATKASTWGQVKALYR